MAPTTLTQLDQLDLSFVAGLDGLMRFVALLDLVDYESLCAAEDLLGQWSAGAETSVEFEFFSAAAQCVRNARVEI